MAEEPTKPVSPNVASPDATESGKLDAAEKRKIGRGLKTVTVEFDLTVLPADLVEALRERHKMSADARRRHEAGARKGQEVLKEKRRRRIKIKHDLRPRGAWDTDHGWRAKIREHAGEWITRSELQALLQPPRGLLAFVLNDMWRKGALLKRMNPGAAVDRLRATGAASCLHQYRLAEKETAP
jgi:hypothetical protein